jgi:hypothetical protein
MPPAAEPRPGGHGHGGGAHEREGARGNGGVRERTPLARTQGSRERRAAALPAGQLPPAAAPLLGPVESGYVQALSPRPHPHPAGPARPYPRHDAQDGVRLPDQGVGVEGAPRFTSSVSTPFHRGCTARRPPLGARRRLMRVRGAPAPSPARGRCGLGLPPGGVVLAAGAAHGARAGAERRAPWLSGARVLRPGRRARSSLAR